MKIISTIYLLEQKLIELELLLEEIEKNEIL